jgi:hypothetical protein
MATDLEVSTGSGTNGSGTNNSLPSKYAQKEIARRSELEKGGYYRTVVSPDQYLKSLKNSSQKQGEELELEDEPQSQTTPDLQESEGKSKTAVPLKHWNTNIKKHFEACSDSQKKAWVDSFKIIEKGYNKKLTALQSELEMAAPLVEFLIKHEASLLKLRDEKGVDPINYLDTLINFDIKMAQDPVYEIARLIAHHKIKYEDIASVMGLAEDNLKTSAAVNQHIAPLKNEISQLKQSLGLQNVAVNQEPTFADAAAAGISPEEVEAAKDAAAKVEAFFGQKDSTGKPLYPQAIENIEEILEEVQKNGLGLDDAYQKVVNGVEPQDKKTSSESDDIDYDEPMTSKSSMNARDKEKAFLQAKLRQVLNQYQ